MSRLLATELFQTGPDPRLLPERIVFALDNALTTGLVYNPADNLFYTRTLPAVFGTGDVVGPATSVATQIPRYADATGKLIDASVVTIDAGGTMVMPTGDLFISTGNLFLSNGNAQVNGNFSLSGNIDLDFDRGITIFTNRFINAGVGGQNVFMGLNAGPLVLAAGANTVVGSFAGTALTGNGTNVFVGRLSGSSTTTGTDNVFLGDGAGSGVVTGSGNILISANEAAAATGVIRLGTLGTQTTCFIQGVDGVVTGGAAVAVLIDANGQAGTVSSGAKFKDQIKSIAASTAAKLHQLRPVSFVYKAPQLNEDGTTVQHYGLIADETIDVFPEIVVCRKGEPVNIRYDQLYGLMLAEIQSLRRDVTTLSAALAQGVGR